jgi:hypothetical protein
MNVNIKVIPHRRQRYDTCGDWFYKNDTLFIRVSALGDWRMEMAVAVHELVECLICRFKGISQEVVDAFDQAYDGDGEPGDSYSAPYHHQHCIATGIERIVIAALGVSWKMYEARINALQFRK